jgi:flagellar hook-associated protein 3 FlgL
MKVNTQGKDAIDTDIYRAIDYLTRTIEDVDDVEERISNAEKMIANTTDEDELEKLNAYKESLETEKSLRVTVMTEAFGKGLSMVDDTQETLNVALAELGTRYNRLELTSDKLSNQKVDVEEQLSNNEDVDISDAYINLTQADNLYQYSLTATSKILGNTLLDYI